MAGGTTHGAVGPEGRPSCLGKPVVHAGHLSGRHPDGRVVAGVNLAVQARDWSPQRIVRELKPVVLATCMEISSLLSHGTFGA
jgi:hypothetical protein